MKTLLLYVVGRLVRMGGVGLLLLGFLDSSFLVMPLGNDLLVILMSARQRPLMPYYAAVATVGSLLGCLVLDILGRKGEEALLEKHVSGRRLQYIRDRVKKGAGWALAVAALMPPPFPFTPFVIAAAAFKYPRARLLGTLAAARFARFVIDGILGVLFGPGILRIARTPAFEDAVFVLILISVVASGVSVYTWIRNSKRVDAGQKVTR